LTISGERIQGAKNYRSGIYASSEGEMVDTSATPVEPAFPTETPAGNIDNPDTTMTPPESPPLNSAELENPNLPSDASLSAEPENPNLPSNAGLSERNPFTPDSEVIPAVKTIPNTGKAGSIYIEAGQIVLKRGAISTDTTGSGTGGNVTIGKAQQVTLTDGAHITSGTRGTGPGGSLNISVAGTLTLSNSRIYGDSLNPDANAGNAGEIMIQANEIRLINRGKINTSSQNAAGGNVTVTTPHLLYLQNGDITTSVKGGQGRGGDITIQHPVFVVLNQGTIKAQADAGRGGDIQIRSQQFLHSPHSIVSASSRLGIDGNIVISAPAEKVSKSLLVVSIPFKDLSDLLKPLCSIDFEEYTRSSFLVFRLAGTPPWPDDLQPSHSLTSLTGKPAKSVGQMPSSTTSPAFAMIECKKSGATR
jgi:hypothetical protein